MKRNIVEYAGEIRDINLNSALDEDITLNLSSIISSGDSGVLFIKFEALNFCDINIGSNSGVCVRKCSIRYSSGGLSTTENKSTIEQLGGFISDIRFAASGTSVTVTIDSDGSTQPGYKLYVTWKAEIFNYTI